MITKMVALIREALIRVSVALTAFRFLLGLIYIF